MKRNVIVWFSITAMLSVTAIIVYAASLADLDEAKFSKMYTGKYLYTNPDLSLGGGMRGEIIKPDDIPIAGVFALPPHEPKFVYKANLAGKDLRTFEFVGLPPAKYDLFIAFQHEVWEGLTLNRYKDTLTDADRKSIEYIINKSDPFFEKKVIHRVSGLTGKKKGYARAVVSMIRLGPVTDMANNVYHGAKKRNYKVMFLQDVGPGFQVARSRDILSKFVDPGKEVPKWNYRPYLSSIRITDKIKELGQLDLSVVGEMPELPDPVEEIDPGAEIPVEEK